MASNAAAAWSRPSSSKARTEMWQCAISGTTLSCSLLLMRVTLKVTPRNIVFRLWMAIILYASSMTAERPRCGSAPECAGTPWTSRIYLSAPLRALVTISAERDGSRTRAASTWREIWRRKGALPSEPILDVERLDRGCSRLVHGVNMADDEQAGMAISSTCRHQIVPILAGIVQSDGEAGIAEPLLQVGDDVIDSFPLARARVNVDEQLQPLE